MANCSTCGNKLAFLEAMKNLVGPKRCDQCLAKFDQASRYWLGLMQQQFDQGRVATDSVMVSSLIRFGKLEHL